MVASLFSLGSVVVNFGVTAKVVGAFAAADGRTSEKDGWPILQELGRSGRVKGGKWVADPGKCQEVQ